MHTIIKMVYYLISVIYAHKERDTLVPEQLFWSLWNKIKYFFQTSPINLLSSFENVLFLYNFMLGLQFHFLSTVPEIRYINLIVRY